MTDIQKQIIEIIEDYMDKTLSEGCICIINWDYYKLISIKNKLKTYLRLDNQMIYEKSFIDKILWHYDITAVLKYIRGKHSDWQWAYRNTTIQEYTDWSYLNVWWWFTFDNSEKFHNWDIPNKPLNLYTEQENASLLELLKKLWTN